MSAGGGVDFAKADQLALKPDTAVEAVEATRTPRARALRRTVASAAPAAFARVDACAAFFMPMISCFDSVRSSSWRAAGGAGCVRANCVPDSTVVVATHLRYYLLKGCIAHTHDCQL